MLVDINHNISNVTSSSKATSMEIKNKLSALLDTPPPDLAAVEKAVEFAATSAVEALTKPAAATEHALDLLPALITDLRSDLVNSNINLASVKSFMEEMVSAVRSPKVNAPETSPPHQMTLEEELAENIPRHQQQTPPQQTIEQQQTEPLPASNKPTSNAIAELFAERRAKMSKQSAGAPPKNEHSSSGWRMIGNKRCWKQDWSGYDIKRSARQLQEKTADKARHSRKRRKQQRARINSQQLAKKTNNNKPHMGTDKELLATAKTQFSVPPSSIDHPIAGLSVPKPISFRKGEIINPYRAEKQRHPTNNIASLPTGNATPSLSLQGPNQQNQQQQQQPQNQALCSSETRFDLDPMRPPIVRLTEQSTEGDGRFLKARLRDPKIMGIVRLFLAYMKDQPATVCVEGLTPTSIRMLLASEGLPTDPEHLLRIFSDVHQEYGLDPTAAMADLQSYRQYLSSERTHRLQQLRESANMFSSPSPFRK